MQSKVSREEGRRRKGRRRRGREERGEEGKEKREGKRAKRRETGKRGGKREIPTNLHANANNVNYKNTCRRMYTYSLTTD